MLKGKYEYPEIIDPEKDFILHCTYDTNPERGYISVTREQLPLQWNNEILLETFKVGDLVDLTILVERYLTPKRLSETEVRTYIETKPAITKITPEGITIGEHLYLDATKHALFQYFTETTLRELIDKRRATP